MKTLFLYAPDRCLPTIPYSSLPALQACLRRDGYETEILDLNVELFDHLVDADRLRFYVDFVRERFAALDGKERLTREEHGTYRFLAPLVAPPAEAMFRAVEGKEILRDPARFYDPDQFNRAFDDLTAVVRFVYAATPVLDPENRHYVDQLLAFARDGGDPLEQLYRERLIDLVLEREPDVLAFTVPFHTQLLEVLRIMRHVRERRPDIRCVVGGPTIHDYRERLFADGRLFEAIDFALVGDGENAICRLLDALHGECDLSEVPNLYRRDERTGEVIAPTSWDLPSLDSVPTPDFDGVPFDRYLLPERLANFQTSRGCYYGKCTFCGDGFRRNFRMRRPDLVYEDIRTVAEKWGVKFFLFWDSLAPPRTLIQVARRIRDEGPEVYWFAETKFEYTYANPDTVRTLYEGGARVFQFGFESAVDRVLRLIDKGNELAKVDACLDALADAGIGVCTSWFIGFPTEREHEMLTTYGYVSGRRDRIVLSVYSGVFNLGRDTIVYQQPERFGVRIVEDEAGGIRADDGLPAWDRWAGHEGLEPRGDLPLLIQGGYLLYHTRHPERLRRIVAKGRSGPLADEIEDIASAVPVVPERNRVVRYRFEPQAECEGERIEAVPSGVRIAFVALHGHCHRIDEVDEELIRACDGARTFGEIVDTVAARRGEERRRIERRLRRLIDLAIVVVPVPLPSYRGLARLEAAAV